jgi:hypothetical protein
MKYLIICLTAIIFSCGGSSQDQIESTTKTQKVSEEKSCLAEITDPAKWYSLSAVASLVNEPEENIEEKVQEKYRSLQYNWRNDRTHTMKAGKVEMEVPTRNIIAITIKNLDEAIEKATKRHKNRTFTYAEYFDSYYSQVTKEDQKIIDEQIDKKGEEDENFDAKTVKKLLAMAPTENYTDIEDLGDDANMYVQLAPGLRETRLALLHGNAVVQISVDISDDDVEDLAIAKTVAKAVMSLCD